MTSSPPPIPGTAQRLFARPPATSVVPAASVGLGAGAPAELPQIDLGANGAGDATAVWQQIVAAVDAHRISDLAFVAGAVTVRVAGQMLRLLSAPGSPGDVPVVSPELYLALIDAAVQREDMRRGLEQTSSVERDFAAVLCERRFRVNVYHERRGRCAAFRPLPEKIPSIADVGLTDEIATKIINRDVGLVLVCGKTGSGKTTTLAALIQLINERRRNFILTLEDPIEFVFPNAQSIVAQREIGVDSETFHSGIRAAMRENPDVILVGEIRDPETLKVALQAANTGHLVLGTLHTDRVSSTILRMSNMVADGDQRMVRELMASVTHAILCQTLLPKKASAGGGRQVVREIMFGTPATAAIIRDGRDKAIRDAMLQGRDQGMLCWNQAMKAFEKIIDEKAYARNLDPE